MKKAFRDIKRGVNKKVLKVPSIEQKVLDATSNESWGPHGTHLADIAQASRNYHEYQIIMSVVWKRLSDTGKNWRHVHKALTVLEYLVANGSERVIEDIREHGYQISNLASFQYIDSTGRDQGSNVRKKSQSLVALVNDKEKIQEAREKAAASRDRFRQTSGGPGDDQYEGQYGSRDEDRNGYDRERDWNNRDSYGRDSEDRSGRDSYGDDEYRRKGQSIDGDYGAKSQSSDRDDGHHSSRGSNARVEDASPDGSRLETKLSGQNLGAPPSYENAVSEAERHPPPPAANTLAAVLSSDSAPSVVATPPSSVTTPPPAATTPSVISDKEPEGFDFFDPRAAPPAAPSVTNNAEVDLFGSLSDSFSSDVLALVPSEPPAPTNSNPSKTFAAASTTQQFDDPFGDGPFRAVPSTDVLSAQHSTLPFAVASADVFSSQQSTSPFGEPPQTAAQTTVNDIGFGDGFDPSVDILAGILPPTGPPAQNGIQPQSDQVSTQIGFPSQTGQPNQTPFGQLNQTPFGQPNQTPFGQPNQTPFSQPNQIPISQPNQTQFDQPNQTPFGQPNQNSFGQPNQTPYGQPKVTPFGQPNQTPFDQPKEPPFGQPKETPFGQPNQTPFGQPYQTPFDQPKETPFGQPNQTPFGQPKETPLGQPNQTPFDQSNQTPFGQPNQTSFSQPNQTPIDQPKQTPFDQPKQTPFDQPTSHTLPQSAFPVQGGYQSISPPTFPAQGGQSVMPPSFPAANGVQSDLSSAFSAQGGQSLLPPGFPAQSSPSMLPPGIPSSQGGLTELSSAFPAQGSQSMLPPSLPAVQSGQSVLPHGFPAAQSGQSVFPSHGFAGSQNAFLGGISSQSSTVSQAGFPNSNGQSSQPNNNLYGGFQPQNQPTTAPTPPAASFSSLYQQPALQSNTSKATQPPSVTASTGALAIVPQQPKKEKFETKSTVWTDTLNRGLVNLNIDGSKTNPLSDIGIDFEAINRKEKRMEKPSKTPVTSNVAMGKAMGSGSGIGRAGASALRSASNPMSGSAMGMGQGQGFGGPYGGLNQPMGMNNMPNNMPHNMGMGMNNGHGFQMQPQPQPAAGYMQPGNYNPMMGRGGGYGHQPYGGYR